MIRILHVPTNGFCVDGILRFLCTYVSDMDDKSAENTVVTWCPVCREAVIQAKQARMTVYRLPNRTKDTVAYMAALYRLMQDGRYDVAHVHGSSALTSIECLVAYLAGIRVRIVHSHATGCGHPVLDGLLRPALRLFATDRLSCGDEAGRFLFGNHMFSVIPNVINLNAYQYDRQRREEWRNEHGVQPDERVIVCVANFFKWKNQQFLIDVMGNMEARFRLVLVGDGPERMFLESYVMEHGLSSRILFTGRIDDVATVLSAADIFCLPSQREGFPVSLLEAQAAGLPCLISDQIDKGVQLTDLVCQVPLSGWVWKRKICEFAGDRTAGSSYARVRLKRLGYHSADCGRRLFDFYKTAMKGE